jgi:hypothetical protein
MPPPELTKSGKPLTKKEKKAVCPRPFFPCSPRTDFHSHQLKEQTAGPKWFDLPAPAEADLPRLHKEYQALRLRNQLDPKRFYRKDPGEARGIKGLPKHFAVRALFNLPLLFLPSWLRVCSADWHDRCNKRTIRRTKWGQSTTLVSQAYVGGRIGR